MSSPRGSQPVGSFQPRMTPTVLFLMIALGAIFLAQLSFRQFANLNLEPILGFVPVDFVRGSLWQIVTYPFLHGSLGHLALNAIMLYMLGSELELRWGSRRFRYFYAVCAVGGAVLQMIIWGALSVSGPANWAEMLGRSPVVGASGALYGLLLAFGYLYSDALLLLFFVLPIKAKHFVIAIFFIEIVSAVFYSGEGGPAHLVHLGGIIAGFIYLRLKGRDLDGKGGGFLRKRMGRQEVKRRLSLVVDNEKPDKDGKYPITWN